MTSLNRVFLAGNLTRDPEVRYTPSGQAVANLGLAVTEKYRSKKTGEMEESVCYVDLEVWGRQAETCGEYLSKGSPVLIEGRLKLDQWETDSGEKRSRMRVRADRVQFLSSPRRAEYAGAPGGAAANDAPPKQDAPPPADEGDSDDLPF
jgi:single-strand DNA-binding protein